MSAVLLTALLLLQGYILSWDAPTTGSNGKPLNDLAGFVVYMGETSGHYTHHIDVGLSLFFDINRVANLERGILYYFAVTAYDTATNESIFSDEVSNILHGSTGIPGHVELEEAIFVIYPNPFDAFVTVETGGRDGVVKIHNLMGHRVGLIDVGRSGGIFDTSRLTSGVYLFTFEGLTIKGLLLR